MSGQGVENAAPVAIITGMYKRRIKVFLGIVTLVLLGLVGRLVHIQIVRSDYYLADAEKYLSRIKLVPAIRGKILDRKGRILAVDEPCYDLCLDYRLMTAREEWFTPSGRSEALKHDWSRRSAKWIEHRQQAIAKEANCSPEQAETIFRDRWLTSWHLAAQAAEERGQDLADNVNREVDRIARMTRDGRRNYAELYQAHPVVRGLGREVVGRALSRMAETVGLEVRPAHLRNYPRSRSACHVIGLTGPVNQGELDRYNEPEYHPDWLTWQLNSYHRDDTIGKSGIEGMCEGILRGQRGCVMYRDDLPAGPPTVPLAGSDVHLTLDIELQEALGEAFARTAQRMSIAQATGAIVVLDVPTGEVLALVSIPTFDLNTFRADYQSLVSQHVMLPLWHRAIAQCYAPGSTVKPVAAMSAMAEGKITPNTKFSCDGGLFPLSRDGRPKCWIHSHGAGHGRIDLVEALRYSCNVYFDFVGHYIGPVTLCKWYRLFGFGSRCGTGLSGEAAGLVPTDEWMMEHEGRHISIGDAWNMAIGQGSFSASPLHVANAIATVARGGRFISPMISLEGHPKRIRNDLPISDRCVNAIHEGMRQVVHHRSGTAHKYLVAAGLDDLGIEFCGKTGTAQVSPQKIDSDGDGRRDTVVREGNVVWFAGFAPYQNPKIAFAVMLEYVEAGGGEAAGPLALDVVSICRQMGYIEGGNW